VIAYACYNASNLRVQPSSYKHVLTDTIHGIISITQTPQSSSSDRLTYTTRGARTYDTTTNHPTSSVTTETTWASWRSSHSSWMNTKLPTKRYVRHASLHPGVREEHHHQYNHAHNNHTGHQGHSNHSRTKTPSPRANLNQNTVLYASPTVVTAIAVVYNNKQVTHRPHHHLKLGPISKNSTSQTQHCTPHHSNNPQYRQIAQPSRDTVDVATEIAIAKTAIVIQKVPNRQ